MQLSHRGAAPMPSCCKEVLGARCCELSWQGRLRTDDAVPGGGRHVRFHEGAGRVHLVGAEASERTATVGGSTRCEHSCLRPTLDGTPSAARQAFYTAVRTPQTLS